MPRWNNNLESNCKDVMDNIIKNINPILHQQLLHEMLKSNLENNKRIIEKFLRNRLNLSSTLAKHTKQYWLSRGWSDTDSHVKSKENKQTNCKSVYSQETWLGKINPATGTHFTVTEADFERNSRRPIRKEYWIKKGFSEEESIKLANDTKQKNNKKGSNSSKTSNVCRVTSKRCVDYYLARGYNDSEADDAVSSSQRLFSKDICIEKYGKVEGLAVWQRRQDQWQKTLDEKSDEEKARINKLKLYKNGSISKGEKLLLEYIRSSNVNCNHQLELPNNKVAYYVYDIEYNKKIIEYNGDFWHANPKIYSPTDVVPHPNKSVTAQQIWAKDDKKIQFARDQGYEVLVVWESDFKKNKEEIIKQCIQFLTQ